MHEKQSFLETGERANGAYFQMNCPATFLSAELQLFALPLLVDDKLLIADGALVALLDLPAIHFRLRRFCRVDVDALTGRCLISAKDGWCGNDLLGHLSGGQRPHTLELGFRQGTLAPEPNGWISKEEHEENEETDLITTASDSSSFSTRMYTKRICLQFRLRVLLDFR